VIVAWAAEGTAGLGQPVGLNEEGGLVMGRRPVRIWHLAVLAVVGASVLAGCSSSGSGSSSGSTASKTPILIGASLSLTGDFSADGQAFQKGYNLWVSDVNSSGGLLGRQVKLTVLNDASSPTQVVTNYQKLINVNHVNLLFGPFSSLLTAPASQLANRYGFAFVEGAGGAPAVFGNGLHNLFDVSLPVKDSLVPFANWIASLPASERPTTASYPTSTNIFTQPQVQLMQQMLQADGIKTVYSKSFPEEVTDYKPIADNVAAAGAQAIVLGSVDVPTVSAFIKAFAQQHYNPKIFIATAGPDQGATFVSAVGSANTDGVMVPNGWFPGYTDAQSQKMVNEYVAKYGGNASGVNSDVAEAYAVGQVVAQAVKATGGVDNAKIISYLHSGVTLPSVQGPVQFDSVGENGKPAAFIFQWQGGKYVQVLPASASGSVKIVNPKPPWGG
jgi:branched-chain amino acid transport system substrate-binding protein